MGQVSLTAPALSGDFKERSFAILCGMSGLLSVSSLLAWVFGLGAFSTWYRFVSLPSVLLLLALAVIVWKRRRPESLRVALAAGIIGGLVGTVGYDLFRVPFEVIGIRMFVPIDSYGVLALDATSSNPWTGLAGWAFHFSNGMGFGVAYAMVALGRKWWWGIGWGLVLETATIVTPFASTYALQGKWGIIIIAYAAHVAYGLPLGFIVQSATSEISLRAALGLAAAVFAGVTLWQQPWSVPMEMEEGIQLTEGASAVVRNGRFHPEWLRIARGGCAVVVNRDQAAYELTEDFAVGPLEPSSSTEICSDTVGIHRVRLSDEPFSGGFLLVDPEED